MQEDSEKQPSAMVKFGFARENKNGSREDGALKVELDDNIVLHAFHTPHGVMFSMSEIAVKIFQENPVAFGKGVRQGRYTKIHTEDMSIMETLAQLGILPDSSALAGATLLSPETLEQILQDKRKFKLVPFLRVALMRLVSEEAAMLIGKGRHNDALPLAMDAIKQGRRLFDQKAPIQLVPFYLLAVQANLALGRTSQCEELLGVASWLFLQDASKEHHNEIHAELARLFGQVHVLRNNLDQAIQAFSEEIYYVSLEHGILDMRTSIGFYNLMKVFKTMGRLEDCMSFSDVVVQIWLLSLQAMIMKIYPTTSEIFGALDSISVQKLKDGEKQIQSMHLIDIMNILQDIRALREQVLGHVHIKIAEVYFVIGLLYLLQNIYDKSYEGLRHARDAYEEVDHVMFDIVNDAISLIPTSFTRT